MNKEEYFKDSEEISIKFEDLMDTSNLFHHKYMNNDECIENYSNEEFVMNLKDFNNLLSNERFNDTIRLSELLDDFDEILYESDNENNSIKKEKIVNIGGYDYKVNIELIE